MISAIIATFDCERSLAQTLAALVPGAVDGLVTEAIVADGGSRDGSAIVADAAGCTFIGIEGSLGWRLKAAAGKARAPFLLFVRPGTTLEPRWVGEARRFTERPATAQCAAVFRRAAPPQTSLREAWALLAGALGALPGRDQGLLIARQFYDALGGHPENAADAERDLLRRIGRRRLVTLAAEILD